MTVEVSIATTHNGSALRDELAAALEADGYSVSRGWYELRSVDAGELIILVIGWKVGVITDELLRELVRTSVAAFKQARRGGPAQAIVEIEGNGPVVEYWIGPHVPDEALDSIEHDAATSVPGQSKHWDDDRRQWLTIDEIMGE